MADLRRSLRIFAPKDGRTMRNVYLFSFIFLATFNALAGSAKELCEQHKLCDEESVLNEFHRRIKEVVNIIGDTLFEQQAAHARIAILEGQLEDFECLVGDTSCELRTLLMALAQLDIFAEIELDEDTSTLVTLTYILSHALVSPFGPDGFSIHDRGGDNDLNKLLTFLGLTNLSSSKRKSLILALQRAVACGSVVFARKLARSLNTERARQVYQLGLA